MKLKFNASNHPASPNPRRVEAFSRVDLMATVAIVGALSLLGVPQLAHASLAATGNTCLANQQVITSAWQQYAADHNSRLVNNYSIAETMGSIGSAQFDTWANNILDWTTAQGNTNLIYLLNSKLYPYIGTNNTLAFKCPADSYRSSAQTAAGFPRRVRSYSMNTFMGKNSANDPSVNSGASSTWAPGKRQFLKTSSIPDPAYTLVFLDEHPDSINDGVFIEAPFQMQWFDLPGSQHNGGCGVGYADGHGEIHTWVNAGTKATVRYGFLSAPSITSTTSQDYLWLTSRMTVDQTALAMNRRTNGVEVAWSALSTNYVLEANSDISTTNWTIVEPKPVADYGTKSLTTGASNSVSFFRLHRY
jgi:prepilin-type processing-associated H-X9-DG protein